MCHIYIAYKELKRRKLIFCSINPSLIFIISKLAGCDCMNQCIPLYLKCYEPYISEFPLSRFIRGSRWVHIRKKLDKMTYPKKIKNTWFSTKLKHVLIFLNLKIF